MRLERDRHLVSESPLHARADGPQKPRRRRGQPEPDGSRPNQQRPMLDDAVAEQHQPEREERIRERRELRQDERRHHQPWLVAVAETAETPHRRQRRRQRRDRVLIGASAPGRQARTSYVVPSSSSDVKRCACRSNIVRYRPFVRHQLVMRAELDDAAVLEDADAIGVTHRGKAVRDQDRGALSGFGEDPIEDLRLAAHVELRGGLVEQHHVRAALAPRTRRAPARRAATGRRTDRCRCRSRAQSTVSSAGQVLPRRPTRAPRARPRRARRPARRCRAAEARAA